MPAKRKKAGRRQTPAKKKTKKATTTPAKKTTLAKKGPARPKKKATRWPAARLLDEARIRTRQIGLDAKPEVQQMLVDLLDEAGWTRAQFVRALVADVEARR
jgi:hypothetical protein